MKRKMRILLSLLAALLLTGCAQRETAPATPTEPPAPPASRDGALAVATFCPDGGAALEPYL